MSTNPVVLKHLAREFNLDPHKLRKILRLKFAVPKGRRWSYKEGSVELKKVRDWISKSKGPIGIKTAQATRASSPTSSPTSKKSSRSAKQTESSK